MRTLVVLISVLCTNAFADIPVPTTRRQLSPKTVAINAYDDAVLTDSEMKLRISELKAHGLKVQTEASATELSLSCGVAGCTTRFLVTSLFTTGRVNTQGIALGAIVEVRSRAGVPGKVTKVLEVKDLEALLER